MSSENNSFQIIELRTYNDTLKAKKAKIFTEFTDFVQSDTFDLEDTFSSGIAFLSRWIIGGSPNSDFETLEEWIEDQLQPKDRDELHSCLAKFRTLLPNGWKNQWIDVTGFF